MMNSIKVRLPGLLLASVLIGAFFVPVVSAGGENTNWLDTIDGWAEPRDMSMYNKPIVTKEPVRPGPEDLARYPGMILLGENVTFPERESVTVSGLPSGPTAQVVVADPAYFSPVPPTGEVNLTNLPPLRKYDLATADLCVPPDRAGGSPDATGGRVASLVEILSDAMRLERA